MSDKKALITGAGGFIGKHLCQHLQHLGYQIIACTNNNVNSFNELKNTYKINLPHASFDALIDREKPDIVFHCAGGSSVMQSFADPETDFNNNVLVTEYVLSTLKKYSAKTKMIFLSSAAVYGNPKELPITTNTPTNPISPYGFHKLLCELNCKKYYKLYGIPITIARIFSVYGPGLEKQILWDIYKKSLSSNNIALHGTGSEVRDFIYIDDLVDILEKLTVTSTFDANIVNIATGNEITIHELATLLLKKLGKNCLLQFNGQTRAGDPLAWRIDVTHLNKLIDKNWISIEFGIQNYVQWLMSRT